MLPKILGISLHGSLYHLAYLQLCGQVIGHNIGQLCVQPTVELHQVRQEVLPCLELRALQNKLCEHRQLSPLLLKRYVPRTQEVVGEVLLCRKLRVLLTQGSEVYTRNMDNLHVLLKAHTHTHTHTHTHNTEKATCLNLILQLLAVNCNLCIRFTCKWNLKYIYRWYHA